MPVLKYFENDLVIEKGKEHMKWYRLRKEEVGGKSVRCVATCCYSTVAVDHPFYKVHNTVKLGNKELFDKGQNDIKEPFSVTNLINVINLINNQFDK